VIRLAEPAWLVVGALAVAAVVVWLLRRRWQRYPVPGVDGGNGSTSRFAAGAVATASAGVLAAAALAPLAVSLARPQEVLSRTLERAEGIDMVIALDVSDSMGALDFQPSDRLGVAKEVIGRFLADRPDDLFGLVVFAGAAVTMCPLTLDHDVASRILDDVGLRSLPGGTAIGMGLGTAVSRLRGSEASSKVVILVTDGSSNAGQLDPMTAAELAASENITVHTVLVGRGGQVPVPVVQVDPRSGREVRRAQRMEVEINPELLAEISRRTGGTSFRAQDPEALAQVFAEIDRMETTEFTSTRLERIRERFDPWAFAAFVLLVVAVALESSVGGTPW
jgi:Ca-activated chloride channel family protein